MGIPTPLSILPSRWEHKYWAGRSIPVIPFTTIPLPERLPVDLFSLSRASIESQLKHQQQQQHHLVLVSSKGANRTSAPAAPRPEGRRNHSELSTALGIVEGRTMRVSRNESVMAFAVTANAKHVASRTNFWWCRLATLIVLIRFDPYVRSSSG